MLIDMVECELKLFRWDLRLAVSILVQGELRGYSFAFSDSSLLPGSPVECDGERRDLCEELVVSL